MTADELAASVRAALGKASNIHEVRMFGGTGFMLNGNMVAAASKRGLLLRVGKDGQSYALTRPGARPMEMRGRVMEGYIYVAPAELTDDAVRTWLERALAFVETLPAKAPDQKSARTRGKQK